MPTWNHLWFVAYLRAYTRVLLALAGLARRLRRDWQGRFDRAMASGARVVQGWSAVVALLGLAHRHLNRDHRWRARLTEAVFPFYIAHRTIIVLTR